MELIEKYPITHSAAERRFTVQEAVERQLTSYGRDGVVEQLQQEVQNLRSHLAVLVSLLNSSGKLSDENLLLLLPSFEKPK